MMMLSFILSGVWVRSDIMNNLCMRMSDIYCAAQSMSFFCEFQYCHGQLDSKDDWMLNFYPAHYKFLYFHGQPEARLDNDKSVYQSTHYKSNLFTSALSVLLFMTPEGYIEELRRIWVDSIINLIAWKAFLQNLQTEWKRSTLNVCLENSQYLFFDAEVLISVNCSPKCKHCIPSHSHH